MANYVKLYYFAYLSIDHSFTKLTLNAEKTEFNYRVISIEDCPLSPHTLRGKWKNLIISKGAIDKLMGVFLYEMFCTEDNPLPLLRELYLMYTNYADETKARLTEFENHMRIIANEALKPI
ncbi:MAG: hypothetical protein K2H23_04235 [Oscillospiraceae bacterium]|nr:hypothetical protein [Oscillospiraceae bacterium]